MIYLDEHNRLLKVAAEWDRLAVDRLQEMEERHPATLVFLLS
jgi:hypothetical protein